MNRRRGGGVSNVLLARRPAKAAFRRRPAQCSSVLASWPDDAFVRRMPAAFGNEMPLVVVGLEYVGSAAFSLSCLLFPVSGCCFRVFFWVTFRSFGTPMLCSLRKISARLPVRHVARSTHRSAGYELRYIAINYASAIAR